MKTELINGAKVVKRLSWIDRVIMPVWVFLTLLIFLAFYLVILEEDHTWNQYTYRILYLIIIIWLYPLYTLGFTSLILGIAGNILVVISAFYVCLYTFTFLPIAALLIAPLIIWEILGLIIMLGKLRLKRAKTSDY